MALSPDDLQAIVEAIDRRTNAINMQARTFTIDPERHFVQHEKLERLITAFESAESAFWKWFLALALGGIIIIALVSSRIKQIVTGS